MTRARRLPAPWQYLEILYLLKLARTWIMYLVMLVIFVSCLSSVLSGGGSNSPSSYESDLHTYERGD
jgi:sensor histidine kinase YesM